MEQRIALYENLTVIFGIAAAVFLIVSVVLYFAFDMKGVISKRLGLTEKQALKRMQADAEAAEKTSGRRARRVRELVSGTVTSDAGVNEKPQDAEPKKKLQDTATKKKPDSILAALEAEQENERLMQAAMAATVSKNAGYAGGSQDSETNRHSMADSETTQLGMADGETTQLGMADSETTQLGMADSETTQLGMADSETTQLNMADGETMQLGMADSETTQLHTPGEDTGLYVGSQGGSWQHRQFTDAPDGMELEETGETVVLHEEAETGVLSQNAAAYADSQFMLIRHIMLIHTDEVIA